MGKTYIITNAAQGWVELSAQKFMPSVFEFLLTEDITVISARTMFEKELPCKDIGSHIYR